MKIRAVVDGDSITLCYGVVFPVVNSRESGPFPCSAILPREWHILHRVVGKHPKAIIIITTPSHSLL